MFRSKRLFCANGFLVDLRVNQKRGHDKARSDNLKGLQL